jgi:hypothetical protein
LHLKILVVTGGWRKLHNEELHSLYSSPSIIRMIKSRRMRWAGHVARMGEKRNAYRILLTLLFEAEALVTQLLQLVLVIAHCFITGA